MILVTAFYFGALVAAALAIGYLGHDVLLDRKARRRREARRRETSHAKALARLRTSTRTFATIRAAQTARARNGAAPTRPLLLTWPTNAMRPAAAAAARPQMWAQTWVQPPLGRGLGATYAEITEVPLWAR